MKHPHQPTMDESDLPTSPRKKLKLQERSFYAEMVDNLTEERAGPEVMAVLPQSHSDTASNEQTTVDSTEVPIPLENHTAPKVLKAPQIPESAIDMTESKVQHSHRYSVAPDDLFSKKTTNASEAQLATTESADLLDDPLSKEAACGITEFVCPDLLGFSGILKKRYAFFYQ